MRARTKRVMRNHNLSDHVQSTAPGNTFLPPGGDTPATEEDYAVQVGEEQPKEGAEYPAATFHLTDESTHQAQVEAETTERVKRAKAVSAPRRLSCLLYTSPSPRDS